MWTKEDLQNKSIDRYTISSWAFYNNNGLRLATPEEKKWLNVCIKQDKFIPKEQLDLYDDITFKLKSLQSKPQFEVGKWYKVETGYKKFNHVTNDKFYFSEDIYYDKFTSKLDYCNLSRYRYELLTDLSEIQQYLPDGHVDKIKPVEKSLVGRYLKALVNSPQSTCFKKGDYVKILNHSLSSNKYLIEKDWIYTTDNLTASDWELMPEGFIPPKESEEWIPQVGEYAISLIDTVSGRKKGDLIEIISKSRYNLVKENRHKVFVSTIEDTSVYKTLRKALPHEIPNATQEVKERYPLTPTQAIKSIFDKDFNNPLNEILELPKSSKKKTKQLIY